MTELRLERVSIELTQRCKKACWFCYSQSHPAGATELAPDEVIAFARGVLFRSLTTNGLPLADAATLDALVRAKPDKVHVSIHFPERRAEVDRVIALVALLQERSLRSGVNLLVARSALAPVHEAAARLYDAGIGAEPSCFSPCAAKTRPARASSPMSRAASASSR
jgi:hypothetical protein